ncbi:lipid-binding SYLF domain-containing protein [Acetobacteraceae bacterium ESL0709]|nr:lipid-binding SYLF domain-containing protein [Acetobacteraceae bacterium ESL0697]MDF7678194.1 lipid-binding SYLF domain-containing protein [Acetobacteraceae bacterium ESL0709]
MLIAGMPFLGACSSSENHTSAAQQQILVDQATVTVQTMFGTTRSDSAIHSFLKKSKAVMICPAVTHMSVVFGGSNGKCVFLSKDARNSWSDPAFYKLSAGSFGLQLGYQSSQVIFFIMTQKGIQALLDQQFKFDANASASFSSMSSSALAGGTTATHRDIYAVQKANGVFAGAALGGTKLTIDSAANHSYYNQMVGPEDIVITMRVNNSAADPLRRILMNPGADDSTMTTEKKRNNKDRNHTETRSQPETGKKLDSSADDVPSEDIK